VRCETVILLFKSAIYNHVRHLWLFLVFFKYHTAAAPPDILATSRHCFRFSEPSSKVNNAHFHQWDTTFIFRILAMVLAIWRTPSPRLPQNAHSHMVQYFSGGGLAIVLD